MTRSGSAMVAAAPVSARVVLSRDVVAGGGAGVGVGPGCAPGVGAGRGVGCAGAGRGPVEAPVARESVLAGGVFVSGASGDEDETAGSVGVGLGGVVVAEAVAVGGVSPSSPSPANMGQTK